MVSLLKSHDQVSMFPVDRSVNVTLSGLSPLTGVAEKSATGGAA